LSRLAQDHDTVLSQNAKFNPIGTENRVSMNVSARVYPNEARGKGPTHRSAAAPGQVKVEASRERPVPAGENLRPADPLCPKELQARGMPAGPTKNARRTTNARRARSNSHTGQDAGPRDVLCAPKSDINVRPAAEMSVRGTAWRTPDRDIPLVVLRPVPRAPPAIPPSTDLAPSSRHGQTRTGGCVRGSPT
jgi:hypothetical protein